MSDHVLDLPLTPEIARTLAIGDTVHLRGEAVVTAGFPTHQRLAACIEAREAPPVLLDSRAFFHLGSMSRLENGKLVTLYVNPTTSTRFSAFMPRIISHFELTVVAGKGGLDAASVAVMRETGCVYLSMVGGGAPLLTQGIAEVIETGWDDLIAQFRLTRVRLEMFGPMTVAIDAHGHSVYADLASQATGRLQSIMDRLAEERKFASQPGVSTGEKPGGRL